MTCVTEGVGPLRAGRAQIIACSSGAASPSSDLDEDRRHRRGAEPEPAPLGTADFGSATAAKRRWRRRSSDSELCMWSRLRLDARATRPVGLRANLSVRACRQPGAASCAACLALPSGCGVSSSWRLAVWTRVGPSVRSGTTGEQRRVIRGRRGGRLLLGFSGRRDQAGRRLLSPVGQIGAGSEQIGPTLAEFGPKSCRSLAEVDGTWQGLA